MPQDPFVHLHNHTEYSKLDGAQQVDELMAEVARLGQPAVAQTDHGRAFGHYDFYHGAKKAGIKPILGLEAYVAPSSRFSHTPEFWGLRGQGRTKEEATEVEGGKDVSGSGAYTHMTILAKNAQGLRNLQRAASLAFYEGFYKEPRMDRELLSAHAEGLIATTGCPSGEIQTRLRLGQYMEAREAAATYRDIFGAENYFLEVMDHGIDIEREVRSDLLRLAKDLNLPLLATNDAHYVHEHQADMHDDLLCVASSQKGVTKDSPKRFRFSGTGYYIKTAAEMRHTWRDFPEACDNTLLVAEMIEPYDEVFAHADLMPRAQVPDGETQESWFRKEALSGLAQRFPEGTPEGHLHQAEYEMDVIAGKGYASYFLVVADFINWAKENGIRVGPGRGSGAGSMCAWGMRITDLDPIEHGLIFERFLNPERDSMPDFDIDFDDQRRGEVVEYVARKYGPEHVALVNTFGRLKAKQSIKDIGRAYEMPYSQTEALTKAYPPDAQGRSLSIKDVMDPEHPRYPEGEKFRQMRAQDPLVDKVVEHAAAVEGRLRGYGVHAAAVIISPKPLIDVLPMHRRKEDGAIITGYEYPACEDLGLVKMDFLGLKNLTVVDRAIRNIQNNRGVTVDLDELTRDPTDPAVYDLLQRGETMGIFQFEGTGYRNLIRLMRPTEFEDISALGALYRPGPMGAGSHTAYARRKNGLEPVTPIHPELEEPLQDILGTTYGLIVYQEQVMQIAQKVAGYSLGQADLLRRAMGKKKKAELDKQYAGFQRGMLDRGYSQDAITTLWNILLPFSDYAFNKAHSAAYGMISYWTAYLKAHYPAEYMAAILTNDGAEHEKLALALQECARLKIKVLPPDVNESGTEFTPVGDSIRFGLNAVRGVGAAVVDPVLAARLEGGPFESFEDFVRRVPKKATPKTALEALIKGGAFDSTGHTRLGLLSAMEDILAMVEPDKKAAEFGQDGLFGVDELPPVQIDDREWDKKTLLSFERDSLGLYVSDHPLSGLGEVLGAYTTHSVVDLLTSEDLQDRDQVRLAGLVVAAEHRIAKSSGNPWMRAVIEDLSGSTEVLLFSRTFEQYQSLMVVDSVCWLEGVMSIKEDGARSVMVNEVRAMDGYIAQERAAGRI